MKKIYEYETDNRDINITEVTGTGSQEILSIEVWGLLTNLIENQTEDTYYVDKLEELKSELELHVEENEISNRRI